VSMNELPHPSAISERTDRLVECLDEMRRLNPGRQYWTAEDAERMRWQRIWEQRQSLTKR
jgi:hypothetical protein